MKFIIISSLVLPIMVLASTLKPVETATRLKREKERAAIQKERIDADLREKKLNAEEKADELTDKADDYLEKKKKEATEGKDKSKCNLGHKWNQALDKAKVKE